MDAVPELGIGDRDERAVRSVRVRGRCRAVKGDVKNRHQGDGSGGCLHLYSA
jgi:hypothetical protein